MFNLWAAICTIAERITLPASNPNWNQLTATVQLLSKSNKRTLTLKYHPDKLSHVLGRNPTDEEIKMSTLAMSALNLLFSDDYLRQQKSIMATMAELDALNKVYVKSQKKPKPLKEPKPPKEPSEEPTKRKPTAYNNFLKITIPAIKKEHGDVSGKGQLMKMASAIWNALSKEEKKAFA